MLRGRDFPPLGDAEHGSGGKKSSSDDLVRGLCQSRLAYPEDSS